jgi:regulator of protease activity HflC (stomatin/prohibitin superfamily)
MIEGTLIVAGAVAVLVIVLIAKGVRIVQQAQTMVIERLGKYHKTLESGINLIVPMIDRPREIDWHQTVVGAKGMHLERRFRTVRIDLRETVYLFPSQTVITKDNVLVEIDALIYFQITTPCGRCARSPTCPTRSKAHQTTLRNVIGSWISTRRCLPATTSTPSCARSWTRRPTNGAAR